MDKLWNFLKKIIRFGSKIQSIRHGVHYNVSPANAFKICRNYKDFLTVMLSDGEGPFNFEWVKGGPGEVGAEVKYGLKRDGMFNTIWEEITQIETDEKTGIYTFSWKNKGSDPWLPIKGYQSHWEIKPYKDEESDRPHCQVVWTQTFPTPLLFGFISLAAIMKKSLRGTGSVITNFIFRQYYEQEYPSTNRRLPKKGDRVAIVGAGPSGLHMAHLLKNKVGIEDITIFERTDRYGGKTVTVDSETNKGVVHE
ncbi:MAG: NAD(P)-binding protein, partial [Candidatus Sifarchaeia archaeon]